MVFRRFQNVLKTLTSFHFIKNYKVSKPFLFLGVPVLCGSSFKNIGVQCLMDAIIHYLPSPLCLESGKIVQCFGNNLCAKAFKVRHDEHKGPVTFFRIYSGTLQKVRSILFILFHRNCPNCKYHEW